MADEPDEPTRADKVRSALTGAPIAPIRGLQQRAGSPAVRLTSYVPPALALALRHRAIDRGETSNAIVRRALEEHLAPPPDAERIAATLGLTAEQRARLDEILLRDHDVLLLCGLDVRKALR